MPYTDIETVTFNALRLTNPVQNSYGYATITQKQKIIYGFESEFTFNIMDPKLKWDKYTWINDIAHGFSLILQNQNVDLDTLGLDKDKGLGYAGLSDSIAIEFDFYIELDATDPWKTHPGKPHLSVQFSNPLSEDHQYSLGFCWLPYPLTKGEEHQVRIEYIRGLEEQRGLSQISFTDYNTQFLDFTGSTDWYSEYKLGLIKVYIDDMQRSVLEMPINIGAIVSHDNLDTVNPSTTLADGVMAGKTFVSLSSTTSNTTDRAAAFQFSHWKFSEIDKWRISSIEWLKARDLTNTKVLRSIKLKNIGKDKLFFKFIYKNYTDFDYILSQEYWAYWIDRAGHTQEVFIDYSYFNGFLDGWELDLHLDDTIKDVIVHDHLNETYTSLNTYFETLDNTHVSDSNINIWMRKNGGIIEVGFWGCKEWVDIFDELEFYTVGKQDYWAYKYQSHSKCHWFEASRTDTTSENLVFQEHDICTECVYDSQWSWFYTQGTWNANANNYVIGNPLEPTLTTYGFVDNTLDSGRVTDGLIKGPIWDWESAKTSYEDTSGNIESYKTFPDYQLPNETFLDEWILCLRDSSKVESDWYSYCGNGVEVEVS